MASLIDAGFLNNFIEVFMFLLIFSILYGVFTKIDFFKLQEKGRGLNAILAVSIALITLISANVRAMIATMVPWFFVLFLFIILMIIAAMIFGATNEDMVKAETYVYTWIIIFGVIILLFSLGAGFGSDLLNKQDGNIDTVDDDSDTGNTVSVDNFDDDQTTNTGNYESNLVRTLFHPKVLGLLLLGIIGLISAIFITKSD